MNLTEPAPGLIGVAGDWHANAAWATRAIKRITASLPAVDGGQPRLIVHLGDFGIWPDSAGLDYVRQVDAALERADAHLWFIDGNHEDYTMLARLARGPGGRRRVTDRIWHLPRGHRWRWHDRGWLALGGGVSLDRAVRTPGRDWWEEEEISAAQAAAVAAGGAADVMITHDCPQRVTHSFPAPPSWWSPADLARNDAHRERLQEVTDAVRPRWLMHGHLHRSYQRRVDMGWGHVEVTGFARDGVLHGNWGILDTARMRWVRFQGWSPVYLAKNLTGRVTSG